jgi:chromosomal replication initiator protein
MPSGVKATEKYIREVKKLCLQDTKYSIEDIDGKKRFGDLVKIRQIAQVIVKRTTYLSKVAVAQEFGGRDHTTFLNSEKQVNSQYSIYPEYRTLYNTLYSKALKLKEIYI